MRRFILLIVILPVLVCISGAVLQQPEKKITFNQHIAPIMFSKCTPCHRPGEIGPMPFTNYSEIKKHVPMIKHVTATGYMPPWFADNTYREFHHDLSLGEVEKELIQNWIAAGAPEGRGKPVVKPELIQGSKVGIPDTTICMERSYLVPGVNRDQRRAFAIPLRMKEDRHIGAVEFRPGNTNVVHHAWVLVDTAGRYGLIDRQDTAYGFDSYEGMMWKTVEMLPGYLPGMNPIFYPKGSGKKLYKECWLILDVHYGPTPVDEWDKSCVNIFFRGKDEPVKRDVQNFYMSSRNIAGGVLRIPPDSVKTFKAKKLMPQSASIINIMPHMHFRGRSYKAYAVTQHMDTIPLININNWDFNWQASYYFDHLIRIPQNSWIYIEATYDNTVNNPFNPVIPPVLVERGKRSTDEMLALMMEYIPYRPGDENRSVEDYLKLDNE